MRASKARRWRTDVIDRLMGRNQHGSSGRNRGVTASTSAGASRRRDVGGLGLEVLEGRVLLSSSGLPTDYDQYMLELINLARSDPATEALRYNIELNEGVPWTDAISVEPKQPLAFNAQIGLAAKDHSKWMLAANTFSHDGVGGSKPWDRMEDAGYDFTGSWLASENLAWSGYSIGSNLPSMTQWTLDLHGNLFVDDGYQDRGHRVNMMGANLKEVGIGVVPGIFTAEGTNYNVAMVTTDFAKSGSGSFLTGVAYEDGVSKDNFYTPGEGLDLMTITAVRQSDGLTRTAETWASGGYSLSLPVGTYDVTAWRSDLGTAIYDDIVIDTQNVKLDVEHDDIRAPEIELRGDNKVISSGDTTPRASDNTSFGEVATNGGIVTQRFTIHNIGLAELVLSGSSAVTISGSAASDFTVVQQPETLISGQANTTFLVMFDPSEFGSRTATISIASNDLDENPYTFAIAGFGTTDVDLVVGVGTVKLGSTVVAGDGGSASVVLENFSNVDAKGKATIELWASADKQLDEGDDFYLAGKEQKVSLRTERSKAYNYKFELPLDMPTGSYHLIAKVTPDAELGATDNAANNVAVTQQPYAVEAAFVDLSASVGRVKLAEELLVGDKGSAAAVISNQGNINAAGKVTVNVWASADDVLDGLGTDILLNSLAKTVKITAGRSKSIKSSFIMPNGINPGQYQLLAEIVPGDGIYAGDTAANNNAAGELFYTVEESFIDLSGEFRSVKEPRGGLGAAATSKISFKLTNLGNIPANGEAQLDMLLHNIDTNETFTLDALAGINVKKLKPSKSKSYNGTVTFPAGLSQGSYKLIATIVPWSGLGDNNAVNNTFDIDLG